MLWLFLFVNPKIKNSPKKFGPYLTSADDGPYPYYTEQLLKGLKERNVKATFFITGQNVEAYPSIVKEIHENGHLIGNHIYSHLQLSSQNAESFKQEIIKTNEVIKEITGEDTSMSGLLMAAGTRSLKRS